MCKHTTTGNWKLGLLLSLGTVLFWGVLPIALKILLGSMDAFTIVWYRFLAAGIVLGVYIFWKKDFTFFKKIKLNLIGLLAVTIIGLCGNYSIYLLGLKRLSPDAAQIVIQLAPMLLLVGGIIVFHEKFIFIQWIGFAVFFLGLVLFFNQRFGELVSSMTEYTIGILIVVIAAFFWASYALAQKQLLKTFSSETILFMIYIVGIILFFPLAQPNLIFTLNTTRLWILAFCALNTLVAYGCFAEALHHWEASRVSAVIMIVPLITIITMKIVASIAPHYLKPDNLNIISYLGAFLVIGGSMMTALAKKREQS